MRPEPLKWGSGANDRPEGRLARSGQLKPSDKGGRYYRTETGILELVGSVYAIRHLQ